MKEASEEDKIIYKKCIFDCKLRKKYRKFAIKNRRIKD
jgi:hypothetical protein